MKAKITIHQTFTVEIDGKPIHGDFIIKSDWEGLVKLECTAPCQEIIIEQPDRPSNCHDLIPKMLGGNSPNGKETSFTAKVVRAPYGMRVEKKASE